MSPTSFCWEFPYARAPLSLRRPPRSSRILPPPERLWPYVTHLVLLPFSLRPSPFGAVPPTSSARTLPTPERLWRCAAHLVLLAVCLRPSAFGAMPPTS